MDFWFVKSTNVQEKIGLFLKNYKILMIGLRSHAIVKNYFCSNSFNLGRPMRATFNLNRPMKTNKKVTFKHFKQFFNVI